MQVVSEFSASCTNGTSGSRENCTHLTVALLVLSLRVLTASGWIFTVFLLHLCSVDQHSSFVLGFQMLISHWLLFSCVGWCCFYQPRRSVATLSHFTLAGQRPGFYCRSSCFFSSFIASCQ